MKLFLRSKGSNTPTSIAASLSTSQTVSLVGLAGAMFVLFCGYLIWQYSDREEGIKDFGQNLSALLIQPLSIGDLVLVDLTLQKSSAPDLVTDVSIINSSDETIATTQTQKHPLLRQEIVVLFNSMNRKWVGAGNLKLVVGYAFDRLLIEAVWLFLIMFILTWACLMLSIRLSRRGIRTALAPLNEFQSTASNGLTPQQIREKTPAELLPFILELSRLSERLRVEAIERSKVKIARKVAHDIRSPLSALRMISQRSRQMPENEKNLLDSITERISTIAMELLDETRNIRNKQDLVEISRVASTIVKEKALEYSDLPIQIDLLSEAPALAWAVTGDLKAILSNLINNSVEANAKRIWLEVSIQDQNVTIDLKDDGDGISEEVVEKFGKQPVSTKLAGNGIGLSSCMEKVSEWNGQFEIYRNHPKGTVASISLPLHQPK